MKNIVQVEPRLFRQKISSVSPDIHEIREWCEQRHEIREWCEQRPDIVEYKQERDHKDDLYAILQFKAEEDALMFILTFSYYIEQDFDGIR